MSRRLSHRLATGLVAVVATFALHAAWISDLGITDTRGPSISA